MGTKKLKQPQLIKTEGFVFDPTTHSYFLDGKPMTGVTTILGVLAKPALIGWAAKMAVEHIRTYASKDEDGEYMLVDEELLEGARKAHAQKRDDAATKGTDLHAIVEAYVKRCIEAGGKPQELIPDEADIEKFAIWAAQEKVTFLASERRMYSKDLFVAGTVDIVFEKDGKTYIGDVKTYAKIWDRVPFFQAAGYGFMFSETENKTIDGYCILRLSKDGSFEALWGFDVEGDTEAFLACVTLYRRLKEFKQITVK